LAGELVHYQQDLGSSRIVDIHEVLDTGGPVEPGPMLPHVHGAPDPRRLTDQEQIGDSATHLFGIMAGRPTRNRRQWRARLTERLMAGLIQTDDGPGAGSYGRWSTASTSSICQSNAALASGGMHHCSRGHGVARSEATMPILSSTGQTNPGQAETTPAGFASHSAQRTGDHQAVNALGINATQVPSV
jgi:hypothetical protein